MCLDIEQAKKLKLVLEDLKRQLTDTGYASLTPNRADDTGERDDDFQPLNEMHQIIQSSKNRSQQKVLKLIDISLSRFRDDPDLVGACDDCEECIAPARLKIFPYAMYCVKCQSAAESAQATPGGRRNLTDFSG